MKDKKKMIIVCSSLVALLVVALGVMLSSSIMLNSKKNSTNNGIRINEIEPKSIGDTYTPCASSEKQCPSSSAAEIDGICYTSSTGTLNSSQCGTAGGKYANGQCFFGQVDKITVCTSCSAGSRLSGIYCSECDKNKGLTSNGGTVTSCSCVYDTAVDCEGPNQEINCTKVDDTGCWIPDTSVSCEYTSSSECETLAGRKCIEVNGCWEPHKVCLAGEYTNTSNKCNTCVAGRYCPRATIYDESILCPKGSYCPEGSGEPIKCPAGTYNPLTGGKSLSDCISCSEGHYCPEGSSSPTPCRAGTANNTKGAVDENSCIACSGTNEYSYEGASSCSTCPNNSPANSNHTSCDTVSSTCPDHSTTNSNGTCSCDAGYYLKSDGSKCEACPKGKYCPKGTVANSIPNCPAGTYNHLTTAENDRACLSCNGTNEYSFEGATSCSTCPSNATANSSHTSCVCNNSGYTYDRATNKCVQNSEPTSGCGAGQGKDISASSGCSNCAAGTYSPPNDNECHRCDTGYTSLAGSESCTLCADGYIRNSNNECVKSTYACYCNPINAKCEWRNTNANNWELMAHISTQEQCNTYSTNDSMGCFKDKNNKYKWGSYGNTEGYTMVSGVSNAETCVALNSGDPVGATYALSCPKSVIMIGQTISCTYSTSGSATLASAVSSSSTVASVKVSSKYVEITGNKEGNATVYAKASDGNKTNSVPIIVSTGVVPEECTVSTSTGSIATSISENSGDINSYYVVNVNIAGEDCSGQTLTYSATNAKNISPPNQEIISTTSHTYTFRVYPKKACTASTATAKLTNGNKSSVTVKLDNIRYDWHPEYDVCVTNPQYTSFEMADRAGVDEYYTNYGTCTNGGTGYTVRWTRYGCGGGSNNTTTPENPTSEDPTPENPTPENPTPVDPTPVIPTGDTYNCYANNPDLTQATAAAWLSGSTSVYPYPISGVTSAADCKAYACYVNGDGTDYRWSNSSPGNGYIKVSTILSETECRVKAPACYVDQNGNYSWGTYDNVTGYTLVPSITDSNICLNPTPVNPTTTYSCYFNGADYVWSDTSPGNGYVTVPNVTSATDCAPVEEPACYIEPSGDFTWGTYANNSGYIYVGNVVHQQYCLRVSDACYIGPDAKYYWGDYSLDNDYVLTYESNCKTPVPITALNIATIIYIAVAILSIIGVAIIVVANNKK